MTDQPHAIDPYDAHPDDELQALFTAALSAPKGDPAPPESAWWSLSLPGGGGMHMRVCMTHEQDKPWAITDIYVHAEEITATTLRDVPLGRLDMLMNLIGNWDAGTITDAANEDMGQCVLDNTEADPSMAELRERAAEAPAELPGISGADRPRLTRPDGTNPDAFYAQVAAAYREYAPQGRAPAVQIAREASVPVATVRSWIREARRRNHLPPGRKGKAG